MSTNSQVETEVKIYVNDLAIIEQRLRFAGATLTAARVYERNLRYDDAAGSLSTGESVLRLRQDTRARLTYKEAPTSVADGIQSRPELEVEVSDFNTMHTILGRLGFREAWIYEKYRTTYELDGCEIVLDEMPYGNFVEIEGEPSNIDSLLEMLGLKDIPRIPASYSAIFFRLKQALGLTFRDLTFENFRNVSVSAAAIIDPR